ncbi:MAG: hypothetical protein K0R61_3609, partial [Microvirga sp.]|nr:hypothetical protein [Microvirga sp.]
RTMDYMELRNACLEAVISVTQARPDITFEIGDHQLGPIVRLRKHDRIVQQLFPAEALTEKYLPIDYSLRTSLASAVASLDLPELGSAKQPPAAEPTPAPAPVQAPPPEAAPERHLSRAERLAAARRFRGRFPASDRL